MLVGVNEGVALNETGSTSSAFLSCGVSVDMVSLFAGRVNTGGVADGGVAGRSVADAGVGDAGDAGRSVADAGVAAAGVAVRSVADAGVAAGGVAVRSVADAGVAAGVKSTTTALLLTGLGLFSDSDEADFFACSFLGVRLLGVATFALLTSGVLLPWLALPRLPGVAPPRCCASGRMEMSCAFSRVLSGRMACL